MRKIVVLGLVMMLALSGCAGTQPGTEEQVPEIEIEEIPEVTETEKEEEPLQISVKKNEKVYFSEEAQKNYLYLQYCDVTVEGSGYADLKRTIENWSMEAGARMRERADSYKEAASEEAKTNEEFYGYSLYQNIFTARADERVVSLVEDANQYTGGMHENAYRAGENFDARTGKQLMLGDVLSDYENFRTAATERMVSELKKSYGEDLKEGFEENVEALWLEEADPEWYMDATGLVIILQEYTVGALEMGKPEVHLPYEEFEYYIKDSYLPPSADVVARLELNQEMQVMLPNREATVPLMLKYEWKDDFPKTTLWLGDSQKSIGEFATVEGAYFIRSGEEVYCMITVDMASDDYITTIYRLTEGVIQAVDEIGAAIDEGNISTRGVTMESWVYLLGTYSGVKHYSFDKDRGFTTTDTEFMIERNNYVLTTTAELPVTLDGMEAVLPVGSRIVLTATDGATYVKFVIQGTGQIGTLKVSERDPESYQIFINGMSEYECFEVLPYAG